MAIVARCPYCGKGKVRAPDHALGLSATCPRCQNCFTIVETEQTAAEPQKPFRSPAAIAQQAPSLPATAPVAVDANDEGIQLHHVDELQTAQSQIEPLRDRIEQADGPAIAVAEPGQPVGLIALTIGGLALTLSQTPLAHYGVAGAGLLGLVASAYALVTARRRHLAPGLAAVLNGLVLLVIVLRPDWLGLESWHSAALVDDSRVVKAFGHDGLATPAGEWVDTTTASWQRGPVRVSVGRLVVGTLELSGPEGQKWQPPGTFLQLRVRVKNVGVSGEVVFTGWPPAAIRLTDSSGNIVSGKSFAAGWEPSGRSTGAALGPGESVDCLLFFEAVPTTIKYLRLELSGEAFGSPDPVRLQIPWLLLQFRPKP